jgi:hypothetical protein
VTGNLRLRLSRIDFLEASLEGAQKGWQDALGREMHAIRELADVVAERDRLRRAIQRAPHAHGCGANYHFGSKRGPDPCNCFKRALAAVRAPALPDANVDYNRACAHCKGKEYIPDTEAAL